MKENSEVNRVNFANTMHHRQLIRKHIDPSMIDRIEIAQNPSLNYKTAFKGVYHDQLQKTVSEQKEKKEAQRSLYQPYNNIDPSFIGNHSQSIYRISRPFADFDQQKVKRNEILIDKQNQPGNYFFRSQDQYQLRKQKELQATKQLIRQQIELKERKKQIGAEEYAKENWEVRENRRRQMQYQMMEKEKNKIQRMNLASEIKDQMEFERVRRQHKSILRLGGQARHNPITNPIEYHIDNPYILSKMQDRELWQRSQ